MSEFFRECESDVKFDNDLASASISLKIIRIDLSKSIKKKNLDLNYKTVINKVNINQMTADLRFLYFMLQLQAHK